MTFFVQKRRNSVHEKTIMRNNVRYLKHMSERKKCHPSPPLEGGLFSAATYLTVPAYLLTTPQDTPPPNSTRFEFFEFLESCSKCSKIVSKFELATTERATRMQRLTYVRMNKYNHMPSKNIMNICIELL